VLNNAREIDEVLADKNTDEKTRVKLLEFKQARQFAIRELKLPDSGSYREYADIGRNFVVWNVIATRELSIEPHEWCFLIVGCIQYRGYYSKEEAQLYATQLEKEGYDVYVAGVSAYSTLGWFDDPLLNTMMYRKSEDRLNLLFHEMAHQKIYIKNDSKFNEAFATVVAKEGVLRWLLENNEKDHIVKYQAQIENKSQFYKLLREIREELKEIYQSNIADEEKRLLKKKTFLKLKEKYVQFKQKFPSVNYDRWMEKDLNNAHLSLIATYNAYVPYFERKLAENEGNLELFYQQINQLSKYEEFKRNKIILGK
jgi:predicted aminopeptidase